MQTKLSNSAIPVALLRQMAHDMRGPIGTLTTTSDMLVKEVYGELNPKQHRASERIQRSSHRLMVLLDDMMMYVKAGAGQLPIIPVTFDPRVMLDKLKNQVAAVAAAKGLTFQLVIDNTLPAALIGDVKLIECILFHLCWNAVDFTEQGTIEVTVNADGLRWEVSVRDSGPGIKAEQMPHIFEPFWRERHHPAVQTSGFGLGLSLALTLAQIMQGEVALKATDQEGSVFHLSLPFEIVKQ